jgi:CHAP domain
MKGTVEMRRIIRSWIPLAVLVAAVGSGPAAVASVSPTGTAASGQHSRAQGTDVAPQTARALVAAYASFRHIPAGDVSGVSLGSVRTAYVRATRTYWVTASFLPSARASARVLLGFQDGGSIGVFSSRESSRWRMVGYGSQPVSCSASLPAAVRSSWHASSSECGRISGNRTRSGRTATAGISGAVNPQTIAEVAEQNVGVGDTPASTSFSFDCNPFTTLAGAAASTSGCGIDPKFKVQNRNEQWCADFAKWVWEQGGVTADLSTLSPQSASFYQWALDQGQHPSFDSGTPQVGDAILFYPAADKAPNSTFANHVGIVTGVNSNGTLNLVNGDFAGSTNITAQQNNNVSPASFGASIWGSGEHWIYVSPGGAYQIAFEANNSHLWYDTPSNSGNRDTGLGMAADTSPSIAASGEVAFQANNNHLWLYDPSTGASRDTGLGMEGDTSPAIVSLSGGGYEIAFQANNNHLWLYNPSTGSSTDTGLGMQPSTSPAITAIAGGSYEVAFQASNNHLWYYTTTNSGNRDTGLGMDSSTSPAITATSSGSPEIAFQANNNHLWYYTPSNSGSRDTGLGMDITSSPAIVSLPGNGYEIAFQANNFDLWLYTPSNSGSRDTGLGMDAASSPAITASSGSPEVAFQANNNHLWYYTTTNSGNRDTGLGMAPDSSPALPAP